MAESTWSIRERLILEAVHKAEEAGVDDDVNAIHEAGRAAVPDLAAPVFQATVADLMEEGYLRGILSREAGNLVLIEGLGPNGRRAIGQWPSGDFGPELVAELERRADRATDEQEKGRLRKAAEAVGGVGKDVLTDVLAKVIEHQTGMA